jgi:hypothetical protein
VASRPALVESTRAWDGALDGAARWSAWSLRLAELWWQRAAGSVAVMRNAMMRFEALVDYARQHSPLHGDALRGLPTHGIALEHLPITCKRASMARFDDWVTDPAIRRDEVQAFRLPSGVQLAGSELAARCLKGMVTHGGRAALIAAAGDHFASIVSWERLARSPRTAGARVLDHGADRLAGAGNERLRAGVRRQLCDDAHAARR